MSVKELSRLEVCIIIVIMLVQTTNSAALRVAILGSGIAGSTAARTLADRGFEVTVFEAGFGIGGRTSTRITRDEYRYQFDHGAQYIGTPKTDKFREAMSAWRTDGWVKEWKGHFLTANDLHIKADENKDRFVGYPGMHSICRHLLHHDKIRVKLQTQAHASRSEEDEWELVNGKSKESLGQFDWLIASDRNSGNHYRRDLTSADIDQFTSAIREIKSVKSLTAMVVFDRPLGLNVNAIQFSKIGEGAEAMYGSLGWAALDSSKPGRARDDGKECWVLQSNPEAAKEMLAGKKDIGEIREMAREVLVRDFLKCIPTLTEAASEHFDLPAVVTSIGHRWGAAFPILSDEFKDTQSLLLSEKKFIACGDYFGRLPGRIEGAYLSGVSAADRLCHETQ